MSKRKSIEQVWMAEFKMFFDYEYLNGKLFLKRRRLSMICKANWWLVLIQFLIYLLSNKSWFLVNDIPLWIYFHIWYVIRGEQICAIFSHPLLTLGQKGVLCYFFFIFCMSVLSCPSQGLLSARQLMWQRVRKHEFTMSVCFLDLASTIVISEPQRNMKHENTEGNCEQT